MWNRSITRIWGRTRRWDDAKEPGFGDLLLTLISSRANHICFSICQEMLHLPWETCDITTPANSCLLKGLTGGDLIDARFGAWNSDVVYAPADGLLRWQRPLHDHAFRLNRHLFRRRARPIAGHIVAVTPLASAERRYEFTALLVLLADFLESHYTESQRCTGRLSERHAAVKICIYPVIIQHRLHNTQHDIAERRRPKGGNYLPAFLLMG